MKNNSFLDKEALRNAAYNLCDKYVAEGSLPHLQLFLSVDGEILLDHICGSARADGTSLRHDSLYRLASMTKPLTIAAALTMVEEGLLSLDMPVAEILPEFAEVELWTGEINEAGDFESVPCPQDMTLFDLLSHRAGFTYSIHRTDALDRAYAERGLDQFHQRRDGAEYVAALAELPLLSSPGKRFHYSVSIDLLGALLERVAGADMGEILRQRLFEPLGMDDSFFVVPADRIERLTDAWMLENEGGTPVLYDRGAHSRWRLRPKTLSAGGGLVSSALDYHRFLRMMMQGGELDGVRVLSPEHVALMMRNHLPGNIDLAQEGAAPLSETTLKGVGMGLGAAVLLDPERAGMPGSQGLWFWGGLLSTGFFLDPAQRIIGLVMTQLMPSGMTALREDFRRAVYEVIGG